MIVSRRGLRNKGRGQLTLPVLRYYEIANYRGGDRILGRRE